MIFQRLAAAMATVVAIGTSPVGASTIGLNVRFEGFVNEIIGMSAEPFLFNGDRVSGNLWFTVGPGVTVAGLGGDLVVYGTAGAVTTFTGFETVNVSADERAVRAAFRTDQLGEGSGSGQFDLSRFFVDIASPSFASADLFFSPLDLLASADLYVSAVNVLGQRRTEFPEQEIVSTQFSNNFLLFESSSVGPSVVAPVPLPPTLPLLALASAALIIVRRRAG